MTRLSEKRALAIRNKADELHKAVKELLGEDMMFLSYLPDVLRREAERTDHSMLLRTHLRYCASLIEEEGNPLTVVDPLEE